MSYFFFFNDTATTEIYTLSLHDALPISARLSPIRPASGRARPRARAARHRPGRPSSRRCARSHRAAHARSAPAPRQRSEEHTSELQSRSDLVCRLLLEKTKHTTTADSLI